MVTETKLGVAAAGAGLVGLGIYEAPHLGGIFLQNEVLLHDAGLVALGAATLLTLATASTRHYRNVKTEGEPINPLSIDIIPFNPTLSRMYSNLLRRKVSRKK